MNAKDKSGRNARGCVIGVTSLYLGQVYVKATTRYVENS